MRRCSAFLLFILVLTSTVSVFAGGKREVPTKNNVYVGLGPVVATLDYANFAIGAGYERAIGDLFSLGVHAGGVFGPAVEFDLLLKPRFYLSRSALENFFVGANLGLAFSVYEVFDSNPSSSNYGYSTETNTDFVAGVNVGYKFVFGSRSSGFSLEPSLGYDFLGERINGVVALGFAFGGGAAKPAQAPAPRPAAAPRKADTGLYLGIIGFNEALTRREIAILNSGNKSQFQGFVRDLRIGPSTALYHAVDNAITMLEAANLPDDLVSVSIITFTDGSDTYSLERDSRYNSQDEFRRAIQARISDTRIKNLPINAYSIGIQGADVIDLPAFMVGLEALATSSSNVHFARDRNMNEVNRAFGDIARSLYKESQLQSIRLRMPGGFDDGTRIRFTFDNVNASTVGNSNLYIEGTYRRSDRSLQNVVYGGFNPRGTTVSGSLTGGYVTYNFENMTTNTGNLVVMQNAQQWIYVPSMSLWQRNSEFNPNSDSQTVVERKSAVILLVLDCTTSLTAGGANGFVEMKAAADNFLNILTN